VSSQFALYWEQSGALDLAPWIEGDASFKQADFVDGTLDLYTQGEEVWAVPAGIDLIVMYYNQDLFDQAGMPYPAIGWTWDDFAGTAAALRDPLADVFGYAPTLDILDALAFIYQHDGRILDSLERPSRATLDDPNAIEAMQWFIELMFDYDVMPTPAQVQETFGGNDIRGGIDRGQVAMWSGMLSERGGKLWSQEWRFDWGMVPLPRDRRAATVAMVNGYFVSKDSDRPDACWEWISFLSKQTPERQAPARRSLLESTEYEQQVGTEALAVIEASVDGSLMLSPRVAAFERELGAFALAYQAMVSGQATPWEALSQAQQQSR
jgi:multiple sugar transport system substrate-binding protein